jgi:hypothetical protein
MKGTRGQGDKGTRGKNRRRAFCLLVPLSPCLLVLFPGPAHAGLYLSAEPRADLPAQWRGFLLDQQALRRLAVPPGPGVRPDPLREQYQEALDALERAARGRTLTADETADLGALLVRLGRPAEAVTHLRTAAREHPDHFRIAANLGTAWQLAGDLAQAAVALEHAAHLAPPADRPAERLHLALVRGRLRPGADPQALDDLFGVRYGMAGRMPDAERRKLPADALALTQRLALSLPADGRLLWQLGELANAGGDAKTAAAVLEGCVGEFGLGHPDLRRQRQALRALADAGATPHEEHHAWKFRSPRPLLRRFDTAKLPPVRPTGVNDLPWPLVALTTLDRRGRPTFADRLRQLDGRRVRLSGFLQPLSDDPASEAFLLVEYPVGCWFCETPDATGIVRVELPSGKPAELRKGLVTVEGTLRLNSENPEDFLYTVEGARLGEAD